MQVYIHTFQETGVKGKTQRECKWLHTARCMIRTRCNIHARDATCLTSLMGRCQGGDTGTCQLNARLTVLEATLSSEQVSKAATLDPLANVRMRRRSWALRLLGYAREGEKDGPVVSRAGQVGRKQQRVCATHADHHKHRVG